MSPIGLHVRPNLVFCSSGAKSAEDVPPVGLLHWRDPVFARRLRQYPALSMCDLVLSL